MTAIRWLAGTAGLLVILAPLFRLLGSASRTAGRTVGKDAGLRRWPAVAAMTAGFILAGWLLWHPLPLQLSPGPDSAVLLLGSLLYFPAIGLYLWGFATLGADFGVSTSTGADLYAGHRLATGGPFRYVRHPMYLAVIVAAAGALLIFRTWALAVFLPMAFAVIRRAKVEEALLAEEFGDAWAAYAARVPKWLPHAPGKR